MTSDEYMKVIKRFLEKHKTIIWLTSWLPTQRQVGVLIASTGEPWPVVHDAMYSRSLYKSHYERIAHSSNKTAEPRPASGRSAPADGSAS